MATVRHPAFPKVTQEVEGERLAAHLAQGWVLVEPAPEPAPEPEPEPEPEPDVAEVPEFEYADYTHHDTEHVVPPRRRRRK